MKISYFLASVISFVLILSCTSDDSIDTNNNVEKKIVKFIYEDLEDVENRLSRNFEYNEDEKVIRISDENDKDINLYTYNTQKQLVKEEFFEYNHQTGNLVFKEITEFFHNPEGKISTIHETYVNYFNTDNFSESTTVHTITYQGNTIIKTSDNIANNKVIYGLNPEELISSIKVYRNDELRSDMKFEYDANGNCISGSGPINEGSLDSTTDNIALKVNYGTEEKEAYFNELFQYHIFTSGTSFYNLKQILVKQQGNNYPEDIEWYQYDDYTYKEILNNSFDENGLIESIILSELPSYPNYGKITYYRE